MIRKLSIIAALCVFALGTSSCHVLKTMGRYKVLATQVPADKVAVSQTPVSGKECGYFSDLFGWPDVQKAAQNAIDQAPGAVGLKDAKVEIMHTMFAFGYKCVTVTGIPVK